MNLFLLQLGDSALPIGGYSHSWGLEAAIDRGEVRDPPTLERWVRLWLQYALGPCEGVVVAAVCRAAARDDWPLVAEANDLLEAAVVPTTLRHASREMGGQLLNLADSWAWAAAVVAGMRHAATEAPEGRPSLARGETPGETPGTDDAHRIVAPEGRPSLARGETPGETPGTDDAHRIVAPEGRPSDTVALPGLVMEGEAVPRSQGLKPLATDGRPSGATISAARSRPNQGLKPLATDGRPSGADNRHSAGVWHHAPVFATLAASAGAAPVDALLVYLHQAALGVIGAGVRAVPIGHTHGQQVLSRLHDDIRDLSAELAGRDLDTAGSFCPAYEVICDAQTHLYTRLFRS